MDDLLRLTDRLPQRARNRILHHLKIPAKIRFSVPEVTEQQLSRGIGAFLARKESLLAAPTVKAAIDSLRALENHYAEASKAYVFVLSTGHCGTLALQRLLEKSAHVAPFHRNLSVEPGFVPRMQLFYALNAGVLDEAVLEKIILHFLSVHFLDIATALSEGRQFIMANHGATVFAPLASIVFPESRFLYLHRDPQQTFHSYYRTHFPDGQIDPLYIDPKLAPGPFEFRRPSWNRKRRVAWYLHATRSFAKAFMSHMPDERRAEIRSEELFQSERGAYDALQRILQIDDIDFDTYASHFTRKINSKASRFRLTERSRSALARQSEALLARLEATGTL